MTTRQKLRLALSDLNKPRRTPTVEHVYENRMRPRRTYKRRYQARKRKQPNIAAELAVIGIVMVLILAVLGLK